VRGRGGEPDVVGQGEDVDAELVGEPGRFGAVEQVLGQRRAVVRRPALAADQGDPTVEALVSQRGDGLGTREAGADDDDGSDGELSR